MAKQQQVSIENYNKERGLMQGPIPGQSLTSDPASPAPYEKAPKFTNVHEANQYLWTYVTDAEIYPALMQALSNETPIMQIVQVVLFQEFQEGNVNPDLMLMLAEPLAYMLIALAERLDIDFKIDDEEDEEDDKVFGVQMEEERLEKLRKAAKSSDFLPRGFITPDMEQDMESLPSVPSLLSPTVEEEAVEPEVPQQPSLMAPSEGQ